MSSAMLTALTFGVLLCIPLISGARKCCANGDCYDRSAPFKSAVIPLPSCSESIKPVFHLYTRTNRHSPLPIDRYTIPSAFHGNRTTVFVVHGYRDSIDASWYPELKAALLDKEDVNVVLVGWHKGASVLNYFKAVANTRVMGREVAHVIANLVAEGGATYNRIWCAGHSLGAHVCGRAGKEAKLGVIIGLDPAGPAWDDLDLSAGLSKDDADSVQAIHTHGQELVPWGTMKPRGSVDFYPNAGRIQPGCKSYDVTPQNVFLARRKTMLAGPASAVPYGGLSCSHSRAVDYFISSINDPCFTATYKCRDVKAMPAGCTRCHNCPQMGYSSNSPELEGIYYLRTSATPPFCL